MNYTVKKKLLGDFEVKYACEKCGITLESPLHEAGTKQKCPTCGAAFVTPGEDELKRTRALAIQSEEDARARKAEKALAKTSSPTIHVNATPMYAPAAPPPIPQPQPQHIVYAYHAPPQPQQFNGVVTIQKTGKIWKLQILLSALCILGAIGLGALSVVARQPELLAVGIILFGLGFAWYVFARVGAWWCHG